MLAHPRGSAAFTLLFLLARVYFALLITILTAVLTGVAQVAGDSNFTAQSYREHCNASQVIHTRDGQRPTRSVAKIIGDAAGAIPSCGTVRMGAAHSAPILMNTRGWRVLVEATMKS